MGIVNTTRNALTCPHQQQERIRLVGFGVRAVYREIGEMFVFLGGGRGLHTVTVNATVNILFFT